MASLIVALFLSCAPKTGVQSNISTQSLKLIAGSCNHQLKDQTHWKFLSQERAQYYLALGDNVYADKRIVTADGPVFETSLEQLKTAYSIQAGHSEFQKFLETIKIIPTWDDHDYGLNDAGHELEFAVESQAEFLFFWAVPKSDPRWDRAGIYHSQMLFAENKNIQLIVLDTRYFRSSLPALEKANSAPYGQDHSIEKTMLGDTQWEWLEAALRVPADLRILLSSIQLLSDSHIYERWGTFPLEKKRLMTLLQAAGPSLVVSGDRHLGAIYHDQRFPDLWELTTSSLNAPFDGADDQEPLRIGDFTGAPNFGRIEIQDGLLLFSLVELNGRLVSQQSIRLP